MNLGDLDIKRLLPRYMREDHFNVALADVLSPAVQRAAKHVDLYSVWDHIDELSEDLLDELAWELHIDWYDKGAELGVKRALVKNSDLVHMRLGTPWAVEQVISDYFGHGEMREWFDYNGDPHHFKILSTNPRITNDDIDKFLRILNVVKRASSWLDAILITLTGEMYLYAGTAVRTAIHEVHDMTAPDDVTRLGNMPLFALAIVRTTVHEVHDMTMDESYVTAVNGKTGVVELTSDDVPEGDNRYYTGSEADQVFEDSFARKSSGELADGETIVHKSDKITVEEVVDR